MFFGCTFQVFSTLYVLKHLLYVQYRAQIGPFCDRVLNLAEPWPYVLEFEFAHPYLGEVD